MNLAIVGLQWGDEGKGKIVDILSREFDCVARYQGGHNAGHTVKFGTSQHVLHLVPSGIFHPGVQCVVGSGVVIDPVAFFKEIDEISATGIDISGRLFVSNRAHVIFPYHRAMEAAAEQRLGDRKLGTTLRGIGPAYEDKAARRGLRVCDLLDSERLGLRIASEVEQRNRILLSAGSKERIEAQPICADYARIGERLRPFVRDTAALLNDLIRTGKAILFEGAQATLLDIDHGTYPFVTSSSASAGGVAAGLGIAPKYVHSTLGITKAYTTRVGTGPFPTEAVGDQEEDLRNRGNEFGATTGRPRRCGWFDGPGVRYSAMINGLDSIAVTKIDVLDPLAEIPFCVGYKYKGSDVSEFPADIDTLSQVEPVYKNLKGWQTSIAGVRDYKMLPVAAQDYLKFLADFLETPIRMVSTGPEREETIHL